RLADREIRRETRPRSAPHHAPRRRHPRGPGAAESEGRPPDRRVATFRRPRIPGRFRPPVRGARRAGGVEAASRWSVINLGVGSWALTFGDRELPPPLDRHFRRDGGAMFGVAPKILWERRAPADERNRITMAMRPLLVRGERLMIIDAGAGEKMEPKLQEIYGFDRGERLDASLAAAGGRGVDIEVVPASRLPLDHAGGVPTT